MGKKESSLWFRLGNNLKGHFVRVENPLLPGTPDVNYCCGEGNEGWIELKASDTPGLLKKLHQCLEYEEAEKLVGLRPEQIAWLFLRSKTGGACYLIIQGVGCYWLYRATTTGLVLRCAAGGANFWPQVQRILENRNE